METVWTESSITYAMTIAEYVITSFVSSITNAMTIMKHAIRFTVNNVGAVGEQDPPPARARGCQDREPSRQILARCTII